MRKIRTFAAALSVLALVPAVSAAQSGRLFEDSWFWGAKAGAMTFWTTKVQHAFAPMVGGEWLMTRSHGALLLSIDQSLFNENSSIADPTVAGGQRTVAMKDMRRYSLGLLAFPGSVLGFRAYGGMGLSLNVIQTATPGGTFADAATEAAVDSTVEEQRSRASLFWMAGMQAQYQRFSIFGQASLMQVRGNFLFNNTANAYLLEAGIRWNMGTSIDRPK